MSAKGKSKRAEERKRKRRAEKEARKLRYKGYADQGQNAKSKRFLQRSKTRRLNAIDHPLGPCGNAGCSKCSPCGAPNPDSHKGWLAARARRAA